MRIYCHLCDKVQPVQVDDCKDVKTGELYQDIVCGECGLVITSGTGIKRPWISLPDEEIDNINYTSAHMLAREVEAKLKQKNGYAEEST